MQFTTLMSGSAGNCIYIESGQTKVLVDMGCSLAYLQRALTRLHASPDELQALFITHEHIDHIRGVAALAKKYHIPVYASPLTWERLPFAADLPQECRRVFEYGLRVGELTVDFFKLCHDACQPVGFVFGDGQRRLGIATDTGKITPAILSALHNVDGLVIEANHNEGMLANGPYPTFLKRRIASEYGHLSNRQCAQALCKIVGEGTQAVLLAHLSETNNLPHLAISEIGQAVGFGQESDRLRLTVAPNREPHPLITLI